MHNEYVEKLAPVLNENPENMWGSGGTIPNIINQGDRWTWEMKIYVHNKMYFEG